MSLVNTETGELVEAMSETEAKRISQRISLRLDTIADNYDAVLPLIREAIERQAWMALGYRSPGEYAAEEFGGALSRLGAEFRQDVVRELSASGMSTRAIAPVVGVSHMTVSNDLNSGVKPFTPAQAPVPSESAPPSPVTGLDGKTYTRPAPVDHAARADAAVAEFPDLAYYRDLSDLEHCWRLADTLRTFSEPELSDRLATLRRSIALDRSKRDGTYAPTPAPTAATCPTCGQTVRN